MLSIELKAIAREVGKEKKDSPNIRVKAGVFVSIGETSVTVPAPQMSP